MFSPRQQNHQSCETELKTILSPPCPIEMQPRGKLGRTVPSPGRPRHLLCGPGPPGRPDLGRWPVILPAATLLSLSPSLRAQRGWPAATPAQARPLRTEAALTRPTSQDQRDNSIMTAAAPGKLSFPLPCSSPDGITPGTCLPPLSYVVKASACHPWAPADTSMCGFS